MATTTPVSLSLTANVKRTSASAALPAGLGYIKLKITSSTPAWNTLSGTLIFGAEYSTDGGTTWKFLQGADPAQGSTAMALGALDLDGTDAGFEGTLVPAVPGNLVRAYAQSSQTITLNFNVIVS